jgi:hypothetical protein
MNFFLVGLRELETAVLECFLEKNTPQSFRGSAIYGFRNFLLF